MKGLNHLCRLPVPLPPPWFDCPWNTSFRLLSTSWTLSMAPTRRNRLWRRVTSFLVTAWPTRTSTALSTPMRSASLFCLFDSGSACPIGGLGGGCVMHQNIQLSTRRKQCRSREDNENSLVDGVIRFLCFSDPKRRAWPEAGGPGAEGGS